MSCYRVVVLSADAVERLREKLLFIGMSSGAAMRCWQANSNLKSLLYTKAPSYNTRNDYTLSFISPILCHKDFRLLLEMTVFTFFHRSNKVGKQNILDLEGLWIYFLFLQIKRKLQIFWFWGWACYSLWIYNVVSTNTTLLEVQLVQFPWNPSRNGQRSWVSDEIKTSVVKSFLPDEFLTSPWIVKWVPPLLCLASSFRWEKSFCGKKPKSVL